MKNSGWPKITIELMEAGVVTVHPTFPSAVKIPVNQSIKPSVKHRYLFLTPLHSPCHMTALPCPLLPLEAAPDKKMCMQVHTPKVAFCVCIVTFCFLKTIFNKYQTDIELG